MFCFLDYSFGIPSLPVSLNSDGQLPPMSFFSSSPQIEGALLDQSKSAGYRFRLVFSCFATVTPQMFLPSLTASDGFSSVIFAFFYSLLPSSEPFECNQFEIQRPRSFPIARFPFLSSCPFLSLFKPLPSTVWFIYLYINTLREPPRRPLFPLISFPRADLFGFPPSSQMGFARAASHNFITSSHVCLVIFLPSPSPVGLCSFPAAVPNPFRRLLLLRRARFVFF